MAGGNNYTFLRQLLEKIKHSQDALRPTDENINTVSGGDLFINNLHILKSGSVSQSSKILR